MRAKAPSVQSIVEPPRQPRLRGMIVAEVAADECRKMPDELACSRLTRPVLNPIRRS